MRWHGKTRLQLAFDIAVVYSRPTVTDLVADLLWLERQRVLRHPQIAAAHRDKGLAAFIESNESGMRLVWNAVSGERARGFPGAQRLDCVCNGSSLPLRE